MTFGRPQFSPTEQWKCFINKESRVFIPFHSTKELTGYLLHSRHKVSEKAMATHSSTLAWKIPWMEEPGRMQSMGSLRVGHDWATSLSLSCVGGGNGNPLQRSCLENPRDGGAWWAAVYGVAQSWTRLKRLSSSSSSRQKLDYSTFKHVFFQGFFFFFFFSLKVNII